MIGKVTGRVDYIAEDHALIEAAGVGYVVFCAQSTLAALPAPGGAAALYTDLVVREDSMTLYGFRTVAERDWHRLLTSVQGVGAKVSLGLVGTLGRSGLARALAAGDVHAVRAAPGVGPKLAARIVSELKGRAPEMMLRREPQGGAAMPVPEGTGPESPGSPAAPPAQMAAPGTSGTDEEDRLIADAVSALVNLGYPPSDAAEAAAGAMQATPDAPLDTVIRAALRSLAREG